MNKRIIDIIAIVFVIVAIYAKYSQPTKIQLFVIGSMLIFLGLVFLSKTFFAETIDGILNSPVKFKFTKKLHEKLKSKNVQRYSPIVLFILGVILIVMAIML